MNLEGLAVCMIGEQHVSSQQTPTPGISLQSHVQCAQLPIHQLYSVHPPDDVVTCGVRRGGRHERDS